MEWPAIRNRTKQDSYLLRTTLLLSLFLMACVKHLPPAATPERIVPRVDVTAPPREGHGRLVIDVVEGSAPVQRVRMEPEAFNGENGRVSYQVNEIVERLCDATPCTIELQPNNIVLGFPVIGNESALQIDLVHVGLETSVYRRALAVADNRKRGGYVFGIVGTAIGAAAMTTGTALLPIGLSKGNSGLSISGGVTLGAGAALMALSIWLMNALAPSYRPGSWIHYPIVISNEPETR